MTLTTTLTVIGSIVIILDVLTQIPSAATRLVNACLLLIGAIHNMRSALGPLRKEAQENRPDTNKDHLGA